MSCALTLKALVSSAIFLFSACSRTNNLFFGEVEAQVGSHTIRVADCYRTSVPPPERLPSVNGQPAYRFAPCRDAIVEIRASELVVNGKSYGRIGPSDSVLVDHGVVSVHPSQTQARQGK